VGDRDDDGRVSVRIDRGDDTGEIPRAAIALKCRTTSSAFSKFATASRMTGLSLA
jgi:hypothetical protein